VIVVPSSGLALAQQVRIFERIVAAIQAADEGERIVVNHLADIGEGLVRLPCPCRASDGVLMFCQQTEFRSVPLFVAIASSG
jgi:hypothetical protein